ncbi:SMI1/KNR4 family protein [Saccharibacillus sp. JS10]|uniref:SMI1/KNR4 family protein n=1 Tax=Saccharibacillus sp. JS10 TaxID=2950552 RepID=UPI00210E3A98|nr:SMI1/KNR4 family protein [Saccharibacillus sp. JS10]MCQ4085676.1 SMI1/KNR4 family protein [Saccharibacillus sp. JS10]
MEPSQSDRHQQDALPFAKYAKQIERIRQKIPQVIETPGAEHVFGASSHHYQLHAPITMTELNDLEKDWGVKLPEAFAAFITLVGNGGAGPYYGIYNVQQMKPDRTGIGIPSVLKVNLETQDWQSENDFALIDEDLDDEAYEEAAANLLSGTVEIGTMGSSYEILLIVSGEHEGRILYWDSEFYRPFFTYENHFLDWYERWLDEIIAGFKIHWFGTTLGGSQQQLTELARLPEKAGIRAQALKALLRFPYLHDTAIQVANHGLQDAAEQVRYWALTLLAAHAPHLADPRLIQGLRSRQTIERRHAAQLICWYRKKDVTLFVEEIQPLIARETDPETFRFLGYILDSAEVDPLPVMLPAFQNSNRQIRNSAIWEAGKSSRKADYVDAFIPILWDDSEPSIQVTALQSLGGVTDPILLPIYEYLLQRYPNDEYSIRTHVGHRLKEFKSRKEKRT